MSEPFIAVKGFCGCRWSVDTPSHDRVENTLRLKVACPRHGNEGLQIAWRPPLLEAATDLLAACKDPTPEKLAAAIAKAEGTD